MASRGIREKEVPPLLTKMLVSTISLATHNVTMMPVKYLVFCFQILYHVDHSALCDVIVDTDTSSSSQRNVSAVSGSQICMLSYLSDIWGQCGYIRIDFSGIIARPQKNEFDHAPGCHISPGHNVNVRTSLSCRVSNPQMRKMMSSHTILLRAWQKVAARNFKMALFGMKSYTPKMSKRAWK